VIIAVPEITLRLLGYGNVELYVPDAKLYWKLKPNQDCFTKIDHKPVHVNSRGTRGPEFEPEKPPGLTRILSLGDSRTFGWGLSDSETYSSQLQTRLQARTGNSGRVEVINAGVNGWSYPQMLVYFRETAITYRPDIIVIAEANFWTQFSEKNPPDFVRDLMGRVWFKNLLRRFASYHFVVEIKLRHFYEKYRVKFIPVDPEKDPLFKEQQQRDSAALFRDSLEELCRLAQENQMSPLLLHLPTVDDLTAADSPVLLMKKRIAERFNLPLVDMTSDLQRYGKTVYLDADPVHMNAIGNQIIAERLVEVIEKLRSRSSSQRHISLLSSSPP